METTSLLFGGVHLLSFFHELFRVFVVCHSNVSVGRQGKDERLGEEEKSEKDLKFKNDINCQIETMWYITDCMVGTSCLHLAKAFWTCSRSNEYSKRSKTILLFSGSRTVGTMALATSALAYGQAKRA